MILHNLRLKARDKASARWDNLALEVERLHDGAKLFCAVREITGNSLVKLTIHATTDSLCGSTNTSAASLATQLWKQKIEKLNSGRARGHDDLPTERLKSTAGLLADTIAGISAMRWNAKKRLSYKKGVLIFVKKPDEPIGQLASVRSIVLLSALRKTLSLVVLLRIASQSGMSDQSTDTVDCGRKRSVNAYRSSFSAMT